jgi:hypothetical protein
MRRHAHNLSHYRLTSFNMGELVPIACLEVLPGDSFRHSVEALIRVSPLVSPVMHPTTVSVQSFFIPNRLTWQPWPEFITNKVNNAVPTIALPANNVLGDHLGIAPTAAVQNVNQFPFLAYNTVYNEFYRDQDLTSTVAANATNLLNVSWEKDLFTVARTQPQAGAAATMLVRGLFAAPQVTPLTGYAAVPPETVVPAAGRPLALDNGKLAQGAFINLEDFRVTMATQRIREARNKYGSRYKDYLAFLGIRSSDSRLDRPELLGSDRTVISFSEVLQTAPSTAPNKPVGTMAGHGIATIATRPYRRFFEEHGIMITLMFVRPKTIYAQQSHKLLYKSLFNDYWQKEDEIKGDQAIDNREVYSPAAAGGIFGYSDRHYDYRRVPSTVVGSFRTAPDDVWHLARSFGATPVLNASFVQCNPPNRPFADTTEKQFRVMVAHRIQARRLVSQSGRI